jgi:peptidoglycan/xylan/chitin deacetylase (PgdA/CDA1 family)
MNHRILLYHEVTDFPERGKQVRRMSPVDSLLTKQFEGQMALLSDRANTKVVTIDELFVEAKDRTQKVVLTFDDGFIGNYLFALSTLEKYGYKATFFVTVGNISRNRYMSWDQLAILYQKGHSIQSHTMTHPMLGECDEGQITYELETSRKIIEDRVGGSVKYLSLPFGSSSERVIRVAERLGYRGVFASLSNIRKRENELCQFGRIHVKDTYPLKTFMGLLKPNPMQLFVTRSAEVLKGITKEIIGLNNYRKLYRLMHRIEL